MLDEPFSDLAPSSLLDVPVDGLSPMLSEPDPPLLLTGKDHSLLHLLVLSSLPHELQVLVVRLGKDRSLEAVHHVLVLADVGGQLDIL